MCYMENSRKKELFYIILFILMLIILVVGVTYTYYTLLVSDKEDSLQIKTGDISLANQIELEGYKNI